MFCGGCSFNWTVRDPPVDASTDATVTDADDAVDGTILDAGAPADATSLPDAADATCGNLAQAITNAEPGARSCALASGECTTAITDACKCNLYVATAGSSGANKLHAAITNYTNAGCTPECDACSPVTGSCIDQANSSMMCFP